MGLFGGDSKSTKNETNKQQSQGFNEIGGGVSTLQLGDSSTGRNSGITTNVNLTTTDFGSVGKAFNFGNRALAYGNDATRAALNLGGETTRAALNFGGDTTRAALNFGGDTTRAAINSSDASRRDSLNFANSALQRAFEFTRQASASANEVIADTNRTFTNKFAEYANRQTASSDDKVQEMGKWVIGGLLAAGALYAWSNR